MKFEDSHKKLKPCFCGYRRPLVHYSVNGFSKDTLCSMVIECPQCRFLSEPFDRYDELVDFWKNVPRGT